MRGLERTMLACQRYRRASARIMLGSLGRNHVNAAVAPEQWDLRGSGTRPSIGLQEYTSSAVRARVADGQI